MFKFLNIFDTIIFYCFDNCFNLDKGYNEENEYYWDDFDIYSLSAYGAYLLTI